METIARCATGEFTLGDRPTTGDALSHPIGVDVDPLNAPAGVEPWCWRFGELILARSPLQPSIVTRWNGRSGAGERRLILHVQHHGHLRQYQGGQESVLRAGELSLLSASDPYRLELSAGHAMLAVELPERLLRPRLPQLDDNLGRIVGAVLPATRMLHDFLLSLWRVGPRARHDAAWTTGTGGVLLDLIALALSANGDATGMPASPLHERLMDLVNARLCDPDLRTGSMATALAVSIRTVQNIFAGLGTTPTAYVLERRLMRATERLRAIPDESITAIAFDLGFNDSAYFTRCFRKRFGLPPSAWRERHAA